MFLPKEAMAGTSVPSRSLRIPSPLQWPMQNQSVTQGHLRLPHTRWLIKTQLWLKNQLSEPHKGNKCNSGVDADECSCRHVPAAYRSFSETRSALEKGVSVRRRGRAATPALHLPPREGRLCQSILGLLRRAPHTGCLKTTPKARNPKSRCQRARLPPGPLAEGALSASSNFSQPRAFSGSWR